MIRYQRHVPEDSLLFNVSHLGPDYRLSRNFTLGEFQSNDGAPELLLHPALLLLLQNIRDHVGEPVHITSGFRTEAHNKRVGGALHSTHTLGLGADVTFSSGKLLLIFHYLDQLKVGGLKLYEERNFLHIDVGPYRRW